MNKKSREGTVGHASVGFRAAIVGVAIEWSRIQALTDSIAETSTDEFGCVVHIDNRYVRNILLNSGHYTLGGR